MSLLEYRDLCADTDTAKFICGDAEIDKWFRTKSHRDHFSGKHIVTCARFDGEEPVIGFYALSSVVEDAKKLPGVAFFPFSSDRFFPCVQLVYLAVHKPIQRRGYGAIIMGQVIRTFANVGAAIGIPALIVTPLNDDAKRFYTSLGFEPYERGTRMFLPLQTALAAVEGLASE